MQCLRQVAPACLQTQPGLALGAASWNALLHVCNESCSGAAGRRQFHCSAGASTGSGAAGAALPLTTGRQRLVILGTGWGGARLAKDIDPKKVDLTVISPSNHMVFTPLLGEGVRCVAVQCGAVRCWVGGIVRG